VANRDDFWHNVEATDLDKLPDLSRQQLKDYEKYFLEIQYEATLPPHEKQTASDRVALLRSEVDERRHKQNLGVAIAAIVIGAAIAIAIAVCQYHPNRASPTSPKVDEGEKQNNSSAVQSATVSSATPRATRPQASPVLSATPSDAGELGMTLEELNKKYEALNGRFGEQEALVTRLNHKRIKWVVEVLSVGKCHAGICVTFISTTGSQFRITTAEFREEFQQRLYALRKGDRIILEGTLKADPYNSVWYVNSTAFELVPAPDK
jgi:cytoskeletal protein RodZ